MRLAATAGIAVSALMRAKMRSLLTTLGVVIGVAAVIVMQAMGTGAAALVTGELEGMGSNMLLLVPGSDKRGMGGRTVGAAPFEPRDLTAIRRECDAVQHATPLNALGVQVVAGENNLSTTLYGASPEHFLIRDWHPALGRGLTDEDERQAAKVCVLGETVRKELFGMQNPVGAEVRVHETACRVVGVLEPKGASTFGMDQDDLVYMPSTTFARRIAGTDDLGMIMMSAVSESRTDEAKAQVEALMRERRRIMPGEEDDFSIRDMRELISVMGRITGTLTSLLAGVAAISLLVGGIGIMNIMLVSVTERTREIGIRLAVGARARDVLVQFLVEAIVLSLVGGLAGLVLGVGGSLAASRILGIPFTVPPWAALLAIGVSVVVGIAFGVFPARKAARLRPIEALRFE